MADEFSKTQDKICGVGGKHCYCCNCYHGHDRGKLNRLARRRLKNNLKKELKSIDSSPEI